MRPRMSHSYCHGNTLADKLPARNALACEAGGRKEKPRPRRRVGGGDVSEDSKLAARRQEKRLMTCEKRASESSGPNPARNTKLVAVRFGFGDISKLTVAIFEIDEIPVFMMLRLLRILHHFPPDQFRPEESQIGLLPHLPITRALNRLIRTVLTATRKFDAPLRPDTCLGVL